MFIVLMRFGQGVIDGCAGHRSGGSVSVVLLFCRCSTGSEELINISLGCRCSCCQAHHSGNRNSGAYNGRGRVEVDVILRESV